MTNREDAGTAAAQADVIDRAAQAADQYQPAPALPGGNPAAHYARPTIGMAPIPMVEPGQPPAVGTIYPLAFAGQAAEHYAHYGYVLLDLGPLMQAAANVPQDPDLWRRVVVDAVTRYGRLSVRATADPGAIISLERDVALPATVTATRLELEAAGLTKAVAPIVAALDDPRLVEQLSQIIGAPVVPSDHQRGKVAESTTGIGVADVMRLQDPDPGEYALVLFVTDHPVGYGGEERLYPVDRRWGMESVAWEQHAAGYPVAVMQSMYSRPGAVEDTVRRRYITRIQPVDVRPTRGLAVLYDAGFTSRITRGLADVLATKQNRVAITARYRLAEVEL